MTDLPTPLPDLPTPSPTPRPDRRSRRPLALAVVGLLVVSGIIGWDLTEGWRWIYLVLVPVWVGLVVFWLLRVWTDGWRVGYLLALKDCRLLLEATAEETPPARATDGDA